LVPLKFNFTRFSQRMPWCLQAFLSQEWCVPFSWPDPFLFRTCPRAAFSFFCPAFSTSPPYHFSVAVPSVIILVSWGLFGQRTPPTPRLSRLHFFKTPSFEEMASFSSSRLIAIRLVTTQRFFSNSRFCPGLTDESPVSNPYNKPAKSRLGSSSPSGT